MSINLIILVLFTVGAVSFALWKGGPAERIAAAVVFANMLIGLLVGMFLPQLSGTTRFMNDGLAAVILLAITIRYGAPWMGGVMLFYALQFSLHSYYLVTGRSDTDYLHALINNINFAGVIWCLIIGVAVTWRRRVRVARARSAPAA